MANQVPTTSNSSDMMEILRKALKLELKEGEKLETMKIGCNCLLNDPRIDYHLGRLKYAYNQLIKTFHSPNFDKIEAASNFLKLAHRTAVKLVKERSAGTEKKLEYNEKNVPVFSISDFVSVFGLVVSGVEMLAELHKQENEEIAYECVKEYLIAEALHDFVKKSVKDSKKVNTGDLRFINALSLAYHHAKHAVDLAGQLQVREEPTVEWYLKKTREIYQDKDTGSFQVTMNGNDECHSFDNHPLRVRIGTYKKKVDTNTKKDNTPDTETFFTTCYVRT